MIVTSFMGVVRRDELGIGVQGVVHAGRPVRQHEHLGSFASKSVADCNVGLVVGRGATTK